MTVDKGVHTLVGAGCAYEVFALSTRKVPTLSKFCRTHRWFEVTLLVALIVHFHREKEQYA